MSVVVQRFVQCDKCKKCAEDNQDQWDCSSKYLRAYLSKIGWVQKGKKDFCPDCKINLDKHNTP